MNFINKLKPNLLPVYPFLFGIFPVLYLWSSNRVQEPAYVVIRSLLVTLAGVLIVYGVMFALTRGKERLHRAALLATLLSFYLLTFGHLFKAVNATQNALLKAYLLPGSALLVLALLVVLAVRKLGGPNLTRVLNMVSIALVLFQVVIAAPYYLSIFQTQTVSAHTQTAPNHIPTTGDAPQRDVYFILLDNYGRQDILQSGSDFDNSALVDALEQRGFVFPDCAQGNYISTAPVISSILNMDYLNKLGIKDISITERGHYDDLAPLLQNSAVIQQFKNYGYKVVTFRGFLGLIDIQKNVDDYISFDKDEAYTQRLETAKFEDLYFNTTIFSAINTAYKIYPDLIEAKGPQFLKNLLPKDQPLAPQFYEVYQQNIYAYDALERVPTEIDGPKFVYAHMYASHWPFIMRPDGSMRLPFTEEQTIPGYVDGVKYTNSRILGAIDAILASSPVKPVIILQGDHSNEWTFPVEWSGKNRLKILSAYYLPDGGDSLLYPTISPVNNFRLIFDKYFGAQLGLLPDVHYYLDPNSKKLQTTGVTCMSDTASAAGDKK